MIIVSASHFHVYLPGVNVNVHLAECLDSVLNVTVAVVVAALNQAGEGPSRGLLRDCTTSEINR